MEGMLSQDEINALLNGVSPSDDQSDSADEEYAVTDILSDDEKDAIGEIANISIPDGNISYNTIFPCKQESKYYNSCS